MKLEDHPAYPHLFPYQREGAEWLATKTHALLADEMGLGKSVQAIVAADLVGAESICVLCPAVARANWRREFEKWSTISRPDLHVYSYDYVSRNHKALKNSRFDLLLNDESHYLKNRQAKRTKMVLGKEGLIHRAERTWFLTGTPMPNNIADLWPMLFCLKATNLSYQQFVERYATGYDSGFGFTITGINQKTVGEIHKHLEKMMRRRLKAKVLRELPAVHSTVTAVEESPIELDISYDLKDYVVTKNVNVLHEQYEKQSTLMRTAYEVVEASRMAELLQTVATSLPTLRRINGMKKVPAVAELISDELASGAYEKVVIFAYHKDVILGLARRLKEFGAVVVDGSVNDKARNAYIDSFQKDPTCRVFIGQIIACGTAITLHAANHIVFAECDWVAANNAQAIGRCHRIGQKKTVFVRYAAIEGSVDTKIMETLERKTRDAFAVLRDTREPDERKTPVLKLDSHAFREIEKLNKIAAEARALRSPKELADEELYGERFDEPGAVRTSACDPDIPG